MRYFKQQRDSLLSNLKVEGASENVDKGFTLVELLVTTLIIGVLVTGIITIINPSQIRGRARDTQRISDLKTIQAALEQYYLKFRAYPVAGAWAIVRNINNNVLYEGLVDNGNAFLDKVPEDPLLDTTQTTPCNQPSLYRYNYRTSASGDEYVLTAIMEVANSNNGHECNTLTNWSVLACAPLNTTDVCYGVESK